MFHKLLFLGPGGRTVYQGDVKGAEAYFRDMGHTVPANVNPADFYMDVIGGVNHVGDEEFNPRILFEAWEDHMKTDVEVDGVIKNENGAAGENGIPMADLAQGDQGTAI